MKLSGYLRYFFPQWHRILQIKQWRQALNINQHESTYLQVFENISGFTLSFKAREHRDAFDYTYGEIDFVPFVALLSMIKIDEKTVFYDLGSGIGTAVLACAMVYAVKKSVGIEYFELLHQTALQQKNRLLQYADYQHKAKNIEFIHGDFLQTSFDDATHIFINSTAYFGETWEKLNHILSAMHHVKTIITTSKPLDSMHFIVINETKLMMSWGVVHTYIHKPKNRP